MKVVTAEEMRNIDQQTIQKIGIPGIVLMENAGIGVVNAIEKKYGLKKISIFVGKGNNGGDGLVVARHLLNKGYPVKTYIISDPNAFTGDALINLKIAQNMNLPLDFVLSELELEKHKENMAGSELLVDAIFGTGLRGPVRGFSASVIEFVNSLAKPIVAIDLPSGLDANTGKVEGSCIKASLTVTMALPKRGLLLYPGASYTGELQVVDISIPGSIIESQGITISLLQASDAIKLLPDRPQDAHKGTFGRAFILAGSVGFTGAAALTSEAALRVGAGLVTLGIPKSLNPIMEVKLTEVMTKPLPETEYMTLATNAKEEIMKNLENADILAIGPGLSRNSETASLIQILSKEVQIPKVIDADGLNALSDNRSILKELAPKTILTPHPGEMARLLGSTILQVQSDRIGIAQSFAKENGVVLVLKGAPTVISDPQGNVFVNTTGNPGLASGGTGDVLTGAITGFLAQGLDAFDAAVLGVYVHGLAGDLAEMVYGNAGMLAQDVIHQLPKVIQKLKQSTSG
ncbi:NAD(P)H-hydrate dehydratase [Candidatus Poribacteria bacterium]|nr:NAD(P)H-hydrate dehydratase [Candidatus Poribacteria bacterium]